MPCSERAPALKGSATHNEAPDLQEIGGCSSLARMG